MKIVKYLKGRKPDHNLEYALLLHHKQEPRWITQASPTVDRGDPQSA